MRADGGIPAYPDLLRAGELRSVMLAAKTDVVINLAPQIANHLPQQPADWDARLIDEGRRARCSKRRRRRGFSSSIHTSYAFADEDVGENSWRLCCDAVKAGEEKVLQRRRPRLRAAHGLRLRRGIAGTGRACATRC